METLSSDRGISPEAARELLIAISQSAPDKEPAYIELPKNSATTNVVELNGRRGVESNGGGGAAEYRSKLISISYTESPDMKFLPSLLESLTA